MGEYIRPQSRWTKRRTKPRNSMQGVGHDVAHWARCVCGKRAFADKRAAREAMRQMRRNEPEGAFPLRAYECPQNPGRWHAGHDRLAQGPNLNDPQYGA